MSAPPVGRDERRALLMAAAGFFCLMCGYYTLRPMREALALEVGLQYNCILFSTVLVCSASLLPIYWWLVGRTPRGRLSWLVCVPFAVVFVSLAVADSSWYPGDRTVAFVYFVALSSANLYLISVFWSAMADVWRPELAKRFYGYVAAGGSAGAILGPLIVSSLVHDARPHAADQSWPARSSCAPRRWYRLARRSLRRSASGHRVPDGAIPVGGRAIDDLARLARTPYLLGIAGLIVAGQTHRRVHVQRAGQVRLLTLSLARGSHGTLSRTWKSPSTCCRWCSRRWSSPGSRAVAAWR